MSAPDGASPTVTLSGSEARAELPEGGGATVPVSELFEAVRPRLPDTRDLILPDGVKCLWPTPGGFVVVHQTTPRPHRFEWIAGDSPSEYGRGTRYRAVRLALPYLVTLACFEGTRGSVPHLSQRNECFFSNQPIECLGLDTPLHYPALLNCSRFADAPANPLSWICTQHLSPRTYVGRETLDASVRDGLRALLHHLLETGFNRSSEHHEISSWFSETVAAKIDPRLESVEAWEAASEEDPGFVLEVPWLATGHTLRSALARFGTRRRRRRAVDSAEAVARMILQRSRRRAGRERSR